MCEMTPMRQAECVTRKMMHRCCQHESASTQCRFQNFVEQDECQPSGSAAASVASRCPPSRLSQECDATCGNQLVKLRISAITTGTVFRAVSGSSSCSYFFAHFCINFLSMLKFFRRSGSVVSGVRPS